MKRFNLLASALMLTTASTLAMASAAPVVPVDCSKNMYVGVRAGMSIPFNSDQNHMNASYNVGPAGFIEEGYNFLNWYAVEVEGGYIYNSTKSLNISGASTASQGGSTTGWMGMLNGYFKYKNSTPWTPYVGVGIGGISLHANWNMTQTPSTVNGQPLNGSYKVRGFGANWAYQGILGVDYRFAQQWSVNLDYRFLGTFANTRFDTMAYVNNPTLYPANKFVGGKVKMRYNTNLVTLGIDYHF